MKKLVFVAAFSIAATAYAGKKAAPAAAPAGSDMKVNKVKGEGEYNFAEQVKWDMPYGPQGPGFATVHGDAKKKNAPTQMLMKFPAGFDSGWHTHDGEYQSVVVKGTMIHQVQGGQEHKLPHGSHWTNGAKVNHRNACVAEGGECVIFAVLPKGFSFTPKTAEGKDVPAQPKTETKGTN